MLSVSAFFWLSLQADYKKEIYRSFIHNDMSHWKQVIDQMQKETKKGNDFLLELVNYQYGYIAWCLGNNRQQEAETYLHFAEQNIIAFDQQEEDKSMVYAYKTAFYGFHIGLELWKAPWIGSKSFTAANLAVESDPLNPFAYLQLGNIEYYMPAVFGGSKAKALYYYLKAKQLMEQNPNGLINDWNYLGLLTTIAKAYAETGSLFMAKNTCEKILAIEPDYQWVRDELYPQILKEFKNKL
jgi:hypothetical protein